MMARTLQNMTDVQLLAAIRRRDVSAVARVMVYASFYERDSVMRDEARKRGLL